MGREKKILFSTMQVTVITLFVKFLGLIKQSVLAACCGATNEDRCIFSCYRDNGEVEYRYIFCYFYFTINDTYKYSFSTGKGTVK